MSEHSAGGRVLVLASGNKGKLREISELLRPLDWQVRPQNEWNVPEAVEDGQSFLENALIKARHAARLTARPALAATALRRLRRRHSRRLALLVAGEAGHSRAVGLRAYPGGAAGLSPVVSPAQPAHDPGGENRLTEGALLAPRSPGGRAVTVGAGVAAGRLPR